MYSEKSNHRENKHLYGLRCRKQKKRKYKKNTVIRKKIRCVEVFGDNNGTLYKKTVACCTPSGIKKITKE